MSERLREEPHQGRVGRAIFGNCAHSDADDFSSIRENTGSFDDVPVGLGGQPDGEYNPSGLP